MIWVRTSVRAFLEQDFWSETTLNKCGQHLLVAAQMKRKNKRENTLLLAFLSSAGKLTYPVVSAAASSNLWGTILVYSSFVLSTATEKQWPSRSPPGLQYQIGSEEATRLANWEAIGLSSVKTVSVGLPRLFHTSQSKTVIQAFSIDIHFMYPVSL